MTLSGNFQKIFALPLLTMMAAVLAFGAAPVFAEDMPQNKVRLLYFSSFPEIVQETGKPGLAELASAIRQQKELHPETYFIHGGASFGPSMLGALDSGAHMIDILNALEPLFMAVGKKEFSYGYDQFIVNALAANFPLICSNLESIDASAAIDGTDPTFLLETPELKIGFMALTSPNAILEYGANEARALDEAKVAQQYSAALRAAGAEAVFGFADTDYDDVSRLRESGFVDGIFYTHNFGNPHSLDHQGQLYTEGALDGKLIALDVWIESDDAGVRHLKTAAEFFDLASFKPAPDIAKLVDSYRTRLKARLEPTIATIAAPFDTFRANVRTSENGFANLVADALRNYLGADLVLLNAGGIRGNKSYAAGSTLSRGDIQRELPFGNRTALLKVSGNVILQALEHGIDCGLRADGCFIHMSNVMLTFDSNKAKGQRVIAVKIGGKDLEPDKFYSVGVTDFIAKGNDGYTMFAETERIIARGTNRVMWDMVAEFIEQQATIAPTTNGRIVDIAPSVTQK